MTCSHCNQEVIVAPDIFGHDTPYHKVENLRYQGYYGYTEKCPN